MSMPGWQASHGRRSQNGEVIGPLTGQISCPLPGLIGPAGSCGSPPAALRSAAWILFSSARRFVRRPSRTWRRSRVLASALALPDAGPLVADPRADQRPANVGDRVAPLEHGGGCALPGPLEAGEALGGRGRVRLGGADDPDDVAVLVGDPADELLALEQVGEALAVEHDGDDVGPVGLVDLDHPPRQRAPGLDEAGAQPDAPGALGAQVGLHAGKLGRACDRGRPAGAARASSAW